LLGVTIQVLGTTPTTPLLLSSSCPCPSHWHRRGKERKKGRRSRVGFVLCSVVPAGVRCGVWRPYTVAQRSGCSPIAFSYVTAYMYSTPSNSGSGWLAGWLTDPQTRTRNQTKACACVPCFLLERSKNVNIQGRNTFAPHVLSSNVQQSTAGKGAGKGEARRQGGSTTRTPNSRKPKRDPLDSPSVVDVCNRNSFLVRFFWRVCSDSMVHHEGIHRDVRVRLRVTQHLVGALPYRTLV